ncbi:autotransporter outer membrane beta-barrel domain-containing protein, partial [Campylobacter jejuni]
NKKTIDGHIYMGIWQGNGGTISIETFNNEGTITTSNNNDGVIYFEGTTHITTFHNKGTIESKNGKNSISLKAQNNQTPTLENFINEGFIKGDIGVRNNGSNFTGTITVKTFENKGTIGGQVNMGIFDGKSGTINIDTFKNSGTITGTGDYGRGVFFMDIHSAIKTFENTGTISGDGYNCMDGGLHTGGGVVMSGGTIETFINKGTIKSTGQTNDPAGVKLNYATVKTFENTGLISGLNGFLTTKGTIDNFINKGTIESTSKGGREAAIKIQAVYSNTSAITHFTNTGTIKSDSNGVLIESGDKIGTLTNKGTIETKLNGISFFDDGGNSSPDKADLGKIILESGSSIKAGNNGININNKSDKTIKVGGIEVK